MAERSASDYETYEDLKVRLDEIVEAVSDDDLPLDDALELYEEAVSLGLRASDLLEQDIEARKAEEAEEAEEAGQIAEGAAPEPAEAPASADASGA